MSGMSITLCDYLEMLALDRKPLPLYYVALPCGNLPKLLSIDSTIFKCEFSRFIIYPAIRLLDVGMLDWGVCSCLCPESTTPGKVGHRCMDVLKSGVCWGTRIIWAI